MRWILSHQPEQRQHDKEKLYQWQMPDVMTLMEGKGLGQMGTVSVRLIGVSVGLQVHFPHLVSPTFAA